MNELVSIVIPTYRRSEMLERAIKSALAQTYSNLEVLVIDDNGLGTPYSGHASDVVEGIGDSRVRLIQNEANLGGAGARNVGIEHSNGCYIAFLDDDDEFLPDKVELSVKRFEEVDSDKLALVYGWATSVYDNGSTHLNNGVYEGWCPAKLLETRCLAATSQWVCLKSALAAVGGFEKVPAKQDSILMLKLFRAGYEIACVQKSLSLYYEHSGGRISGTSKTIEGERILQEMGKAFYDRFDEATIDRIGYGFDARLAVLYYSCGDTRMCRDFIRRARGHRNKALLKDVYIPLARITKAKLTYSLRKA